MPQLSVRSSNGRSCRLDAATTLLRSSFNWKSRSDCTEASEQSRRREDHGHGGMPPCRDKAAPVQVSATRSDPAGTSPHARRPASSPRQGSHLAINQCLEEGSIMLAVLGWIIFGLVIGALAKLIMPGRDPG